MSDEMETTLRKSLDAVDRGRRLTAFGVAALFVSMAVAVAALLAVAAHVGSGSGDALLLKSLYVATAAQMLFVACCTGLVMFSMTRTAKALLRSIELAGRNRS